MGLFFPGLLVPILLTVAIRIRNGKRVKKRGVQAEDAGGERGITMRNHRFPTLVETPWEDADTLALIFEEACAKYASDPLLGTRALISKETEVSDDGRTFEKVCLGNYMWTTYGQTFQRVENIASGLITIGHRKGERIALFAETRAEWFIALQGCFRQNFTVVTLYASLGEDALAYSLNETEVTTVICDRKQLKKLLDLGRQLLTLKRVIYIDDEFNQSEPVATGSWILKPFVFVESLGRNAPVAPNMPEAADIAVIMYTSGSTGMPKGVMMSHKNVVATVAGVITIVPNIGKGDVYLAYLPLAHILELCAENIMCATGAAIGYGSPLTLTDTSSKIKKGTKGDASALRPTLMTAVPAILDRVRDGVRKKVDSKGGLPKKLFGLAYRRRLSAIEGNWFGAWGLEKYLWDFLVFKNVRMLLGGRVRGLLSGGAPLSGDTQRFINICFGAPIGQGYGLTETSSGATFSEWDDASVGRVGPPVPHCYVKLIDWEEGGYLVKDSPLPRGEIVIGGPSVSMGYFNNQEKTDEVYKIDEKGMRWFYTGDIGQFHVDGCLEIVDRKKDIVKLQHGEYVSLGKVEAILAASRYVVNIMMHADPFHSFCVALVVPSQAELEDWAKQEGIIYTDFKDLCKNGTANKEVLKSLSVVGKQFKLDKFEIPLNIKLLEEPWTPESGLVTAALKLKRENVKKAFADDLKHLYD